jgi:hypothetical protein
MSTRIKITYFKINLKIYIMKKNVSLRTNLAIATLFVLFFTSCLSVKWDMKIPPVPSQTVKSSLLFNKTLTVVFSPEKPFKPYKCYKNMNDISIYPNDFIVSALKEKLSESFSSVVVVEEIPKVGPYVILDRPDLVLNWPSTRMGDYITTVHIKGKLCPSDVLQCDKNAEIIEVYSQETQDGGGVIAWAMLPGLARAAGEKDNANATKSVVNALSSACNSFSAEVVSKYKKMEK